ASTARTDPRMKARSRRSRRWTSPKAGRLPPRTFLTAPLFRDFSSGKERSAVAMRSQRVLAGRTHTQLKLKVRRGFPSGIYRQVGRFAYGTCICDTRIRGLQGADGGAGPDQQLDFGDPLDITSLVDAADI